VLIIKNDSKDSHKNWLSFFVRDRQVLKMNKLNHRWKWETLR